MKIATFGCSWTHGDSRASKYYCWPMHLKTLIPDADISNYAVAGSSILWSVFQLQWVKKHNPADFYIFQMTRPERISYWNDNTDWLKHQENKNGINRYKTKVYEDLQIATIQTCSQKADPCLNKNTIKLAKNYYRVINNEFFEQEYDLAVQYIKNNVDFYYMQTEGPERGYNDILCLEYEFGYDYCRKHWESGTHFGMKGLQRTAEWVYENVKDKIDARM